MGGSTMITASHAVIRTTDPDDAYQLIRLYDPSRPRATFLDRIREPVLPTLDELREGLARKDKEAGALYAVEQKQGEIRGLCGIRGIQDEARYAELIIVLLSDEDYESALAEDVFAFLIKKAFDENKLNKVTAHCLDTEGALRRLLISKGFASNGFQRQVLYSQGKWHDLETLTLFRPRQ